MQISINVPDENIASKILTYLKDIKSKKISLTKIDKNFWNNMDKVIESA